MLKPGIQHPNYKTLNVYIEEALNLKVPFERAIFTPLIVNRFSINALGEAIIKYDEQFLDARLGSGISQDQFPYRPPNELRLAITSQAPTIGENRVHTHEVYIEDTVAKVKQALLFSHSVLVYSPWPYSHRDLHLYDQSYEKFAEKVCSDLKDLQRYGSLIAKGIVIPVPDRLFFPINENDPWLMPTSFQSPLKLSKSDEEGVKLATERFLESNRELSSSVAESLILTALWSRKQVQWSREAYAPLFRRKNLAEAYISAAKTAGEKLTSQQLLTPIRSNLLVADVGVRADALSDADFVNIRLNDELFADWRNILSDGLDRLYRNPEDFTDAEKELAYFIAHAGADWNAKAKEKFSKGVLAELRDGSKSVACGFLGGAVAGHFLKTGALDSGVLGAAGLLVETFFDTAVAIGKGNKEAAAVRSIQSHFALFGTREAK